ncbi:MAG: hypothetical protein RIS44_512 [Pseudomonadota bacterium]|jgi:hypothetical protein
MACLIDGKATSFALVAERKRLTRIFHQGRARVGCDAVRWQGETTLRARAREEEQRS